jgi:uncharacterized protein YjbJ (UPF0337 family)
MQHAYRHRSNSYFYSGVVNLWNEISTCAFLRNPNRGDPTMGSTADKIKGTANEIAGKARQAAGKAVGNHEEQVKGGIQEAKGKAQVAKGDAKDAVKKVVDKA